MRIVLQIAVLRRLVFVLQDQLPSRVSRLFKLSVEFEKYETSVNFYHVCWHYVSVLLLTFILLTVHRGHFFTDLVGTLCDTHFKMFDRSMHVMHL